MKKVLLSLVVMMVATMSFAQNTVVASLSHEGETTMFYGLNGLVNAAAAAQSGDIINLSRGIFNPTTIKAGITLRGAGIDSEDPTYINGIMYIYIPTEDANRFTMEGIICNDEVRMSGTFSTPQIVKCLLNRGFTTEKNTDNIDILVVNSKVLDHFYVGGTSPASLVNSYIGEPGVYDNAHIMGTNCILSKYNLGDRMFNTVWKNCIFWTTNNYSYSLPTSSEATNCVGIPKYYDMFRNLSIRPGCTVADFADVFVEFDGTNYTGDQAFKLTETAKTTYLGTDGTEVGLYGGPIPFNLNLSYPLISTMKVDEQTDSEGKLGVTIEVKKIGN